MSLPKAYVHVLAPRAGALSSFLDDVEASLLEYGLAPEIGRPRSLSEADATEHAQTSPLGASESGWLPYLSTDALAAVDVDESGDISAVDAMLIQQYVDGNRTADYDDTQGGSK